MKQQVQRADWVTIKGSSFAGSVKRVARDGSWADVNWHTHKAHANRGASRAYYYKNW